MGRILPLAICVGTLLVSLVPYALFGTHAHVVVHDHLDANFSWGVVLAREAQIFAGAQDIVQPVLGGLERQYIGSPYQLYFWLFAVLPPFGVLIATEALTRTIAFVGAYAFISTFVVRAPMRYREVLLCSLVAGCFALLPFWPPGGAAVAGLPLFLWAAFKARSAWPRPSNAVAILFCIGLFVLFGSMVLSGIFALVLTSTVIVFDLLRRRFGSALRLCVFNAFTTLGFIWQNKWLLALSVSDTPNSRSEWVVSGQPGSVLPKTIAKSFFNGQYHADPGTEWPIFLAVLAALILAPLVTLLRGRQSLPSFNAMVLALIALLVTAVFYGFFLWSVVQGVLSGTVLSGFNFGRFHWLQPGLWAIAFGAALFVLQETLKWPWARRFIPFSLACFQLLINVNELPVYARASGTIMAFDSFFAPRVFAKMRGDLKAEESPVRLGLIGIHPAIAQYNGFDTLGAYVQIYPLEVKHRFRRIIAAEVAKSENLARYFDKWGNRAYLFVADLDHCRGACFAQLAPQKVEALFDMDAFRDFGGTHIVSTSILTNAPELGLVHINTYLNETASQQYQWRLHLYAFDSQ
ncbi:MAG: DUF6044 family protein [Paracoccaceae bacterium]